MIIDDKFLEALIKEAQENERKRKAYLLHNSYEAPSQRMLNALLPGTEVPVHRHVTKDETYCILKGCVNVIFYNNHKEIISTFTLSKNMGNFLLVIPQGQWHSVDVLEPSVIYEVCDGPYTPLQLEDIMAQIKSSV